MQTSAKTKNKYSNLSNKKLRVGMEFDNYKSICSFLNQPELRGRSKVLQVKKWKKYFYWENKGHRFKITQINNNTTTESNKIDYSDIIDLKFASVLEQIICKNQYDDDFILSKSQLLLKLELCNTNFLNFKRISRHYYLSQFIKMDINIVTEFFNVVDDTLDYRLKSQLNKFQKLNIFTWEYVKYVIEAQDKSTNNIELINIGNTLFDEVIYKPSKHIHITEKHRVATADEKNYIDKIKKDIMEQLKCKNHKELMKSKQIELYEQLTQDALLEKFIVSHYDKIHIKNFDLNAVYQYIDTCNINQSIDYNNCQMNVMFAKSLLQNAKQRHEDSKSIISEMKNPDIKDTIRAKKSYINNFKLLLNIFIKNSASDILEDVEDYIKSIKNPKSK